MRSELLQVLASSSLAVAVAERASMVGLPSCHLAILPHRCSHDYKLLIQKGESKASERPRATDGEDDGYTKTYSCTCQHACGGGGDDHDQPHDGIIQLANIEVRLGV